MALTPAERSLRGKLAVETSWANTPDRPARTAKARKALEAKFLIEADGDPVRAEHLRKAFYAKLQLQASQARRKRQEERKRSDEEARKKAVEEALKILAEDTGA